MFDNVIYYFRKKVNETNVCDNLKIGDNVSKICICMYVYVCYAMYAQRRPRKATIYLEQICLCMYILRNFSMRHQQGFQEQNVIICNNKVVGGYKNEFHVCVSIQLTCGGYR